MVNSLYLWVLLLVSCVHWSHKPIVKLTFPIILTMDGLLIFDYGWFSAVLVSIYCLSYFSTLTPLNCRFHYCWCWGCDTYYVPSRVETRVHKIRLFIGVFPLNEFVWEATLYWSLVVSLYSLGIRFEPIYSNVWSFVHRFDIKVVLAYRA